MSEPETTTAPAAKSWKQRLGIALVVYSFIPICTVELLAFLDVSPTFAVTFGAIYLASGEIAFLAAVALLGKQFVITIKDKVKGFFFRPKEPGRPKPISRLRHGIGVALFFFSIVPYYATMGILFLAHPKEPDLQAILYLLLAGEALFFVSLFILGEEFWARLKRLFEWPGKEAV
ncbi:MAG: transporter suffix domain-containing protein [Desulfovibrio sp.]|nr:transporter suffix domain-containing protein [Desulfovibrio sp.]MBI4958822.1 transporter suffix domain-containing protein [Desulfovibrio sp.]